MDHLGLGNKPGHHGQASGTCYAVGGILETSLGRLSQAMTILAGEQSDETRLGSDKGAS